MTGRRRSLVDPAAVGYAVLAVVAVAQTAVGRASLDDVAVFASPALLLVAARWSRWSQASGVSSSERPAWWTGERGVRLVALAGAALAVLAVVAFVGALPAASGADGFYDVKVRVTTPVADHNVLASLLLVALAAAATVRGRGGWVLTAVVTLGLGASLSRGAVLVAAAVATLAALAARRLPPTRNSTLHGHERTSSVDLRGVVGRFAGGAVGALALVLLAAAVLGAAVPGGEGPTSVASRGELWRTGLAAIAEEPVVGVGLDRFREVAEARGVADPRDHAHSLPLHAAATVGIPAAAVHLALWLLLLVRGWRHPDPRVRVLLLLGGGALLLHAFLDETAFRLPVELTVGALLALGAQGPEVGSRRGGEEGP